MNRENLFQAVDPQLMYEFHAKDLSQTEALKHYADHAVKEIKSTYGWNTEVQIHIESEAKDKHLFSVSMSVFGLSEPIVVQKDGKNVMAILRKVRKAVMRQIHKLSEKKVSCRRKHFLKEQFHSRVAMAG
jgi:ribosome-associated translation inhibitor RaiA